MIALFGPTGVGKTEVAIAFAELLRERGERPDRGLGRRPAGLPRARDADRAPRRRRSSARLEHRLLSFVPSRETFSAGRVRGRARPRSTRALAAGRRPIVVGGTGLYLQAALTDLELRPPPAPELRARITAELDERGPEALHAELARARAGAAAAIAPARSHARGARARAARDG